MVVKWTGKPRTVRCRRCLKYFKILHSWKRRPVRCPCCGYEFTPTEEGE